MVSITRLRSVVVSGVCRSHGPSRRAPESLVDPQRVGYGGERRGDHRADLVRPVVTTARILPLVTRTCAIGDRMFEITLSGTPIRNDSWSAEHVFDRSLNQEVSVPGMESATAPSEDTAFARICDHIEKWLRPKT